MRWLLMSPAGNSASARLHLHVPGLNNKQPSGHGRDSASPHWVWGRMAGVSIPGAPRARNPKKTRGRLGALAVVLIILLVGPGLMVLGTVIIDADSELSRTGVQSAGTVTDFNDTQRASNRDIKVRYTSMDGDEYVVSANVDHDQHPEVGDPVTVAYDSEQPSHAVVLGFESDGVSLRGVGTVLTLVAIVIGLAAVIMRAVQKRRSRR